MTITFSDSNEAHIFKAGESFEVDANSSFDVCIKEETAYLCTYG